jgi:hypothetical protein
MLTISKPPVGAIAFGRSGVPCIVTALESERVVLRCPDGASLRVPLTAIARWELPGVPTIPTPGDRVQLIVNIETSSGIVPAGTEGAVVEPVQGLMWVQFEGSARPCMVMPNEIRGIPERWGAGVDGRYTSSPAQRSLPNYSREPQT